MVCQMVSKLGCNVYIMTDDSSILVVSWLHTLKKYSNLSVKASTLLGESLRSCPSVKCLQTNDLSTFQAAGHPR